MRPTESDLITTTPSDRELEWTREFKAPRHLVFDAWTKPALLARWFGPHGWTLPVCDVDLRPGGRYRWVMRSPDGQEIPMFGEYHEVAPPERLVCTQAMEGFTEVGWRPEDVALVTLTLSETDGRTTWSMRLAYPTQEARDAVLQMGMQFDRFEALLEELQAEERVA